MCAFIIRLWKEGKTANNILAPILYTVKMNIQKTYKIPGHILI